MSKVRLFLSALAAAIALGASPMHAQITNPAIGVPIKIWAEGYIDPQEIEGNLHLSGYFLSPSGNGQHVYEYEETIDDSSGDITTVLGIVRVVPNRTYQLSVSGTDLYETKLNVLAPPGYRVLLEGEHRMRALLDGQPRFHSKFNHLRAQWPIRGRDHAGGSRARSAASPAAGSIALG